MKFRCRWLALAVLAALPPGVRAASVEPDVPYPVVFFPPDPPAYGAPLANRPRPTRQRFRGGGLLPPGGLGDFAGDTLYPALSTRLFSGVLSKSLEARLQAYRTRRNALINALLDHGVMLQDAADDVRERGFRALAEAQAPEIAALEAEADALRSELTRNRLGFDDGWSARRRWRLDSFPANRDWMNLEAEFQIVRAAAFYDEGLSPVQRGLLRELALELDVRARKVRGEPIDRSESDAMFFSPEGTRLRLPPHLPPAVLEQVARYNAQKNALKQQLRETVRQQENASRGERAAAYARLAEEQWPQISELESRAEELRTHLAASFVPVPPDRPPAIPPWLVGVIESYNEDRDTFFGEMREAIKRAVDDIPRWFYDPETKTRVPEDEAYPGRRKEAERQAALEFQRENAERFAALEQRYRAIRSALETIASTTPDPKTGRPLNVESLLRQHTAAMAEFDRFGRASAIYTNYRTAMLQRGLSPGQRRLLFNCTLVGLAQPLPFGEVLPRRSDKYPHVR